MKHSLIIAVIGLFVATLLTVSCEKQIENEPEAICVTADATNITETTAVLSGFANLTSDMTGAVELGFVISEQPVPSLDNGWKEHTKELDSKNKYSKQIKGLSPNIKYYYRAYVLRNEVYMYGEIRSFNTDTPTILVSTGDAQDIADKSAVLTGELSINSKDKLDISAGFYYSTSASSTKETLISEGKKIVFPYDYSVQISFSQKIINLSPEATYYYMAFANVGGIAVYGEVKSIATNMVAVTSVSVSKSSLTLTEGDSETLVATVKPDDAKDKTVSWSSDNPSVVSV